MKNNLKHIASAVITVMVCLFAYQTWWLVRMYRSEVEKTENAVRNALRTSDFNEIMCRLQKAREQKADAGLTGEITVGAGYDEGGATVLQTSTIQYERDTDCKNPEEKAQGTKTTSQVTRSIVNDEDMPERNGAPDNAGIFESLESMSLQMIRGLHTGIDAIDGQLDFGLFDSLLVVSLKQAGLDGRHKVALMSAVDTSSSRPDASTGERTFRELAVMCTEGYVPSSKAVSFEYAFDMQESCLIQALDRAGRKCCPQADVQNLSGICNDTACTYRSILVSHPYNTHAEIT